MGEALRARRKLLGVTQQQLAESVGVSFQQLQKYERGANRISASMLARVAERLEARPGDFFPAPAQARGQDPAGAMVQSFLAQGGGDLARLWLALDRTRQDALHNVAAVLAGTAAAEGGPGHAARD